MKVNELAKLGMVHGIEGRATLREAADRLIEHQVGLLLIDEPESMGVFSERDLARAVASGADVDKSTVLEFMTSHPLRVDGDELLFEAVRAMSESNVRHLPVTRDGSVVGMISARDVLAFLSRPMREAPPLSA